MFKFKGSDMQEKISCRCLRSLKRWLKITSRKDEYDYLSAPFEADIRFIFQNFEVEIKNCKGFRNPIRSLIVDNILRNMNFDPKSSNDFEISDKNRLKNIPMPLIQTRDPSLNLLSQLKNKLREKKLIYGNINDDNEEENNILYPGLPYMLDKGYFNEAFILHEESNATEELNKMLNKLTEDISSDNPDRNDLLKYLEENKNKEGKKELDARTKLTLSWGSMKNLFKFQPLWNIRNYFGEYIALYYAFIGIIVTSLWLPALTGK
jgi:hypothetical protein